MELVQVPEQPGDLYGLGEVALRLPNFGALMADLYIEEGTGGPLANIQHTIDKDENNFVQCTGPGAGTCTLARVPVPSSMYRSAVGAPKFGFKFATGNHVKNVGIYVKGVSKHIKR